MVSLGTLKHFPLNSTLLTWPDQKDCTGLEQREIELRKASPSTVASWPLEMSYRPWGTKAREHCTSLTETQSSQDFCKILWVETPEL
jgi:hypothetical protein